MQTCNLLLHADVIVTQNQEREVIYDGAIAVSDGKIAAIGGKAEVGAAWQGAEQLALGAALVMPGLINTHTHMPMSLLRGIADDIPLMEWLTNEIFPREARFSPHMLEVGTLLSCAEMLRTGTTTVCDMYLNEPHIYRSIDKAGMRAVAGEGIFAFPSIGYADPAKALDAAREQAAELKGNARIRYAISPHSVYTTNLDLLEKCASLARELDLPLHVHLAETASETAQSMKLYGCRPVEACRRAGLLTTRTLIAHGVELNEDEIALLAEHGCSVAHNPRSNMKLASGIAPVPQMLAKGLNVSLGTDGAASNNSQNMFAEMSACALLHKVRSMEPTTLPAWQALDMATVNGGKALGWPELGSLSAGSPADLTVLDLTQPNLAPLSSPVSHLAYAASGHEVVMTMVEGKILYAHGKFPSLDYPALRREAQNLHDWLRKQDRP